MQNNGSCNCNIGYAGNKCQYSDSETCNGNGIVQNNGSCNCNIGYAGNKCQYSDSETCSGNGIVQILDLVIVIQGMRINVNI